VRAFGGCTFCDDRGSGAPTIDTAASVREQLEKGIRRVRKRYKAGKFLAYFQAFTNTYAPEAILKQLYDVALEVPDVVGICIGTRPDCVEDNILDLLAKYDEETFVFLEIGLQTAVNATLDLINRGHSAEEFFDAVKRAKKRNLKLATHLIFGLPNETDEQMLDTVAQVAQCGVDAVKIHQLCIYKGTPMEADFKAGTLAVIEEDRYVRLVADALELLPPEMVIMRLVAEGSQDEIIAPDWAFEKERVTKRIEAELVARGSWQGKRFERQLAVPTPVS
jgi:radical SAM protein (TIGR01212 family)